MRVKEIREEQRPREKALRFGVRSLTDQELVALILSSGTRQTPVMELAQMVCDHTDGLSSWFSCTPETFMEIPGIREVKALQLCACSDLARRAMKARALKSDPCSIEEIVEWFKLEYGQTGQEHFVAVFLDSKGRILCHQTLSIGVIDRAFVSARDLLREALLRHSTHVIVIHNHPSGDTTPSMEDVRATRNLIAAGTQMGVTVLDHLIIGQDSWCSLRQKGLLD